MRIIKLLVGDWFYMLLILFVLSFIIYIYNIFIKRYNKSKLRSDINEENNLIISNWL